MNGKFETLAYYQEIVDANGKRETFITSGGSIYKVSDAAKEEWTEGAETLVSKGLADKMEAPSLQGATNGTIGGPGADATTIQGIYTAGVVRSDNNFG